MEARFGLFISANAYKWSFLHQVNYIICGILWTGVLSNITHLLKFETCKNHNQYLTCGMAAYMYEMNQPTPHTQTPRHATLSELDSSWLWIDLIRQQPHGTRSRTVLSILQGFWQNSASDGRLLSRDSSGRCLVMGCSCLIIRYNHDSVRYMLDIWHYLSDICHLLSSRG